MIQAKKIEQKYQKKLIFDLNINRIIKISDYKIKNWYLVVKPKANIHCGD